MAADESAHWFTRCTKAAQEWLLANPGTALSTEVFDAVLGAGGVPVRMETPDGDRSEAFYLHPADSAYVTELRMAGQEVRGP